ncbi:MAG: hypothetical protein SGJ07_08140 [Rhodospirillaceae bacterium]|nr:hypothetical protein [Rhodospirillaceae bacterium]
MQQIHFGHQQASRVVAVFAASTAIFELPEIATLEDLADRLGRLSEWRGDALLSVTVKIVDPDLRS